MISRVSKKAFENAGGIWEDSIKDVYKERDTVESAYPFSEIELKKYSNTINSITKSTTTTFPYLYTALG